MTTKRVIFEKEQPQSEEDKLVARFTERPQEREARIARKRIDPRRAEVIRRALIGWV